MKEIKWYELPIGVIWKTPFEIERYTGKDKYKIYKKEYIGGFIINTDIL